MFRLILVLVGLTVALVVNRDVKGDRRRGALVLAGTVAGLFAGMPIAYLLSSARLQFQGLDVLDMCLFAGVLGGILISWRLGARSLPSRRLITRSRNEEPAHLMVVVIRPEHYLLNRGLLIGCTIERRRAAAVEQVHMASEFLRHTSPFEQAELTFYLQLPVTLTCSSAILVDLGISPPCPACAARGHRPRLTSAPRDAGVSQLPVQKLTSCGGGGNKARAPASTSTGGLHMRAAVPLVLAAALLVGAPAFGAQSNDFTLNIDSSTGALLSPSPLPPWITMTPGGQVRFKLNTLPDSFGANVEIITYTPFFPGTVGGMNVDLVNSSNPNAKWDFYDTSGIIGPNQQLVLTFRDMGLYEVMVSIATPVDHILRMHVAVMPPGSGEMFYAGPWNPSITYPPNAVVAAGALFQGYDYYLCVSSTTCSTQPGTSLFDWQHIAGPPQPGPQGPAGPARPHLVDATGASRTISLPPPASVENGRLYVVKRTDASIKHHVVVNAQGGALVDNQATVTLKAPLDVMQFASEAQAHESAPPEVGIPDGRRATRPATRRPSP